MPHVMLGELSAFWSEVATKTGAGILVLIVSTVASFILGRMWGRYRARKQWEAKEFLGRIIVSLNMLHEGKLKIRTIFERNLEDVFLNPIAIQKVRAASRRTTLDDPMLPIAKADAWYLLNFVLNAVAEHFCQGLVKQDAGQPVTAVKYALCLTCEIVGDERIRKVRAMLVKLDHLRDFPYPDSLPELENPWHETRVLTLRKMAETYRKHPEQFLTVDLCV